MADLKYFISERQRFRTAADCEEEAMISPRGSLHPAVALVFTTENDTMLSRHSDNDLHHEINMSTGMKEDK